MKIVLTSFFLNIEDYMLPCFTKQLLGFDCPGCGLQRAIAFLLQGDFIGAFKMYPALYPLMLLFGFLALNRFFSFTYANKIIITLMILTVTAILINYISKFI